MTTTVATTEGGGRSGSERAAFYERPLCISCDSSGLRTLDRGTFGEAPHRSLLLDGIWGESPYPYLKDCEWELVQCHRCDQIFHKHLLTPEWDELRVSRWMTKEAIDRFEEERGIRTPTAAFDRARSEVDHVLRLEKMTRQMRNGAALRLLDFGCGWGHFVAIAGLFGFEAHGIDRHNARRDASRGIGTVFENLEEYRANVSQPVHAATLFQVLEHLPAPAEILRALHELIAPNGLLVVEVPDASGFRQLRNPQDLDICDGIDHVNAFTPTSLTAIVERAGFVRSRPVTAHVTADFSRVAKREMRRLVARFQGPTTHGIFRRI